MKKVVIIGAGIAGLTLGVYLRINGFETQIYELHNIPGGECTGWDRNGYHFDGCIHWLVGSKAGTPLNGIWKTTGALDDSVPIVDHDVFARYEENGKAVNLYCDANALFKHLLEIAPEDRKQIRRFCSALLALGDFSMPIDKPMDMMSAGDGIRYAAKNLRGIAKMRRYNKLTVRQFSALFSSPLLQRAFCAAIPDHYTALALLTTLSGMHAKDNGYPVGGSRALAKRMEKRYLALGGNVFYKSRVETILVRHDKAVGIRLADGTQVFSDYVVSCADAYATLKTLLQDKYTPALYDNLFSCKTQYPTVTSALVFMGVNADIPYRYRSVDIRRPQPVILGGTESTNATLLHYGYDKTLAPPGKTVMACFYAADYDRWRSLDSDEYEAEKNRLAQDAIAVLIGRYPQAQGKIEVTDVVTPLTYERFCNAWRGSWMTWAHRDKNVPRYFPGALPGLENFLMAGMWTLPPGGLPGASASGRFAAHRLCIQNGIPFQTE